MSHAVVDVADLPTVWGTFKFVRHHLGARAFGRLIEQERAWGRERLELLDPPAEILERRSPLIEAPEENPDDHSSGGVQGS